MRALMLCAVILPAMLACNSHSDADKSTATPPPTKTVFDPMLEQRDKVKDMAEKLPEERKESLDKAIDSQSAQ